MMRGRLARTWSRLGSLLDGLRFRRELPHGGEQLMPLHAHRDRADRDEAEVPAAAPDDAGAIRTATLLALPLSPWSEKARWALDHHRIAYVERVYTPMVGTLLTRWRLRRLRGDVEPPVLFDAGGAVHVDALEIARHAERTGHGEALFRRGDEAAIVRWHRLSERAMRAARALTTGRMADDPAARQEALVLVAPRRLARLLEPAALVAARMLRRRNRGDDAEQAGHREELRHVMLELRAALADGRRYLVGGALSYCDIAMAAALMGVEPAEAPHLRFGPATRRSSTDLELAGEFTDLLGWRDHLYARHRRARSR